MSSLYQDGMKMLRSSRLTNIISACTGGNREVSPFFCPITWDTLPLFANFFAENLAVPKTMLIFADV